MSSRLAHYIGRHHIGLLALFVALSGTSYAAVTLPRNSVGTAQLKANAVTSAKVKDRSLLAKDFKAGQLPAGAQGPQGTQGPKGDKGDQGPKGDAGARGAPGVSDYERVEVIKNVNPGDTGVVIAASCPAGKKILGGGGLVQDSKLHITYSFPQANDVWGFTAVLLPSQTITSTSQAFAIAICAKVG